MSKGIESKHKTDNAGNPAGGTTKAVGLTIKWQDGPRGKYEDKKEQSGAIVEDVLQSVIDRIEFYQSASKGKFKCQENTKALFKLNAAMAFLNARTRERRNRDVEGTNEA